ncbi:uncharacterized protein Pp2C1 [Centruroides vittatus]|uniref:uncharacterized protein Pp2C1 n=1 Tax=Centruroides vittatus TaxID=120091 RepID=UPI00350F70D0
MAPTIGVNLRVTGHCNQGGRKYMEDAFVVAYQQTEDEKDLEYAYFGIFDGHGGREAALFAKEHLMDYIVNQRNFWSKDDDLVLKAIKDGFLATHLAMWKEVGKWPKTMSGLPSTSGTTASVAFIRRGKMYIGHVGDSRIILGCQDPDSDMWLPQPLTKDHKPESPAEKERIYSVGGLVMNKAGVERVVWNRPRLGHKGPIRRSTHFDKIPFLAVARSLGDLWSYNYQQGEFVVSPEPDVCVVTLDPKRDRCVILASDGLWNMVTLWDAVRLVQDAEQENERYILESAHKSSINKQANNPSKLLVDRALNRWYNLKMRADNTSVVTVLLDPPGPPKSEVLLRQRVMQKLRPRDEIDSSGGQVEGDSCYAKSIRKTEPEQQEDWLHKKKLDFSESRNTYLPKPVVLSPKSVVTKRVMADKHSECNSCSSPMCRQETCKEQSSHKLEEFDSLDNALSNNSDIECSRLKPVSNQNYVDSVANAWLEKKTDAKLSIKDVCLRNSLQSSDISGKEQRRLSSDRENKFSAEKHCSSEINSTDMDGIKQSSQSDDEQEGEGDDNDRRKSEDDKSEVIVGVKRKFSVDNYGSNSSAPPLKHLCAHNRNQSWTSDNFSSCRIAARAISSPHCTRTRHRLRKMKA